MTKRNPLQLTAHCLLLTCFLLITHYSSLITVFGQSATATLSGTVEDERGAIIPGASVTVTNPATGLQRQATASGDGSFTIPLLPPATYTVTVRQQGFAPAEIKDVVLNVNDNVSLNIQLKVGQISSETITVNADANTIQVTPEVATVVDRQFVSNLPLNGRSLQGLISLAPGVVTTAANSRSPGQFSVNGQRTESNYFTVDGVSANFGTNNFAGLNAAGSGGVPATNVQGSFSSLASIDAIQEFKIQTSTFAPEFGRYSGANVSIVTRSGENKYHGALYEYFRNDVFDANDFFNNSLGFKKPALRYNNFGGVFGGPVILPRFGEGGPSVWKGTDRTFFFFSYEGTRFTLPVGAVSTVVPSLAARASAANQSARDVLNAFPIPNGAELRAANGSLTGGAIFASSFSQPSSSDAWSVRLDHKLTKNITLFGRYNNSDSTFDTRSDSNLSQFSRLGTDSETLTIGSTQIFTSRLVNELILNVSRQDGTAQSFFDGFGGGIAPPESLFLPPNMPGGLRRGIISLSGLAGNSGLRSASVNIDPKILFRQRQITVVDNLSYSTGSHQLKFGVDYRWLSPIIAPVEFFNNIRFGSIAGLNSGIASDVFAGTSTAYTVQFPTYSFYGQDTWKINSRLTMTYGLRWEINPAPSARGDRDILTLAEVRDPDAVDFSYLQFASAGTPVYPTRYNNFAPRFGISYQARQKEGSELVVRGGGGLFYDLGQGSFGGIGFPYTQSRFSFNVPFPLPPSVGIFPPPNFNLSPTNRAPVTAAVPGYNLPKVYQWNLTAEQSLGKNQTISAAYVAALGRGLVKTSNLTLAVAPNPTNPNIPYSPRFSSISLISNGAASDYHALQIQFTRRLTRGLQANLGYTWSHSIDTGSQDSEVIPLSRITDVNINRGDSDFDVRHALTGAITYRIPAPQWNGFSKAVLGGWSLNSIFFARTGLPFTVYGEEQISTILFGSRYRRRPNLVQGVPIWIDDATVAGGRRLNPAAFSFATATQAHGNFGRNALRGPGAWQIDTGLHRRFALTERVGLQFRWEVFNVFNHTNFSNPTNPRQLFLPGNPITGVVNVNDRNFGAITQMLGRGLGGTSNDGGFNPIFQVGGPRSMQFALRLEF